MKKTAKDLHKKVQDNQQISWITSYNYTFAKACEQAGIDMILVGDSGGMTELGYKTTIPVTMDQMINFCQAVGRGAPNTFLVGDMPQGSYEISDEDAVKNAIRFIKDGGCDAVKLEGGERILSRIRAIKNAGIIVFGHLGLTPQTMGSSSGYKCQGKESSGTGKLCRDISAITSSIDFLLIEALPTETAQYVIQDAGATPVLGIGAGPNLDGQLIIIHDILRLYPNFSPKFSKNYFELVEGKRDNLFETISEAVRLYIGEVESGAFPSEKETYKASKEILKFIEQCNESRKLDDELPNYR